MQSTKQEMSFSLALLHESQLCASLSQPTMLGKKLLVQFLSQPIDQLSVYKKKGEWVVSAFVEEKLGRKTYVKHFFQSKK